MLTYVTALFETTRIWEYKNKRIDDYGDRGNRLKDSRTQNSHPAHSGFG